MVGDSGWWNKVKTVYSSANFLIVEHYKNVLETEGIPCIVKNRFLASAAGELPPTETWPVLCVIEDAHLPRAQEIINSEKTISEQDNQAWPCKNCGETIEGQFSQCWRCGDFKSEN